MPVLHRSPDLISPSGSIPLNNYIPVDTARHFIQLPFLPSAPSIRQPIEPYQNYIHRSRQFLGNRPLPNKRIEFSFESPLLSRSRSTIKETRNSKEFVANERGKGRHDSKKSRRNCRVRQGRDVDRERYREEEGKWRVSRI